MNSAALQSDGRQSVKGYCLLFAGMATVGTYVALSKPLTAALPVFLLGMLRFAIASVALLPWLRRGRGEAPIDNGVRRTLFLQSFFGNFLFSIFMLNGVAMTSAAASGVILGTLPAMVALLSWIWLKERLSLRIWLAVGLAVLGVCVLTLMRAGHGLEASAAAAADASAAPGGIRTAAGGADSALGNLLVLGCVLCEAVYVILGKRLTAALSPMRISALINLVGLTLMTPLGLWQAARFDFAAVPWTIWALLVFYAIAASVVSTWLWLSGLRWVPASQSGVFTIALPLASSVVGVAVLGEHFTAVHAFAFACGGLGIALIGWPARPSAGARHLT